MDYVIIVVYTTVAYWACGKTIYANKMRIGSLPELFLSRLIAGVVLGIVLVPMAIIKVIFETVKKSL